MSAGNWVARLRAFARPPQPDDCCELCGIALPARHAHLVDPAAHRMLCACTACALLFDHPDARRFKRVPADAAMLPADTLSDADWTAFGVPVDIAFFLESSADRRIVGFYPGAVGTAESEIDAAHWQRLRDANPALAAIAPDVEALLVNRLHGARECWRMPVDRCYSLAGLIRRHWRGFSGGTEVWQVVERHFEQLRRDLRGGRAGNGLPQHPITGACA